ncbi:predicted protein [Postia placenta Mad-698-R]|nr:predicted protein [Postia placenta Mad-698-R]
MGITIKEDEHNLHLELQHEEGGVDSPVDLQLEGEEDASTPPCQEEWRMLPLPALGGTEDSSGVEALVVTVHWADFWGSKYASSLAAAMVMKVLKEARRQGDI